MEETFGEFLEFTFPNFPRWHTHVPNIVVEGQLRRGDGLGVAKHSETIKGVVIIKRVLESFTQKRQKYSKNEQKITVHS